MIRYCLYCQSFHGIFQDCKPNSTCFVTVLNPSMEWEGPDHIVSTFGTNSSSDRPPDFDFYSFEEQIEFFRCPDTEDETYSDVVDTISDLNSDDVSGSVEEIIVPVNYSGDSGYPEQVEVHVSDWKYFALLDRPCTFNNLYKILRKIQKGKFRIPEEKLLKFLKLDSRKIPPSYFAMLNALGIEVCDLGIMFCRYIMSQSEKECKDNIALFYSPELDQLSYEFLLSHVEPPVERRPISSYLRMAQAGGISPSHLLYALDYYNLWFDLRGNVCGDLHDSYSKKYAIQYISTLTDEGKFISAVAFYLYSYSGFDILFVHYMKGNTPGFWEILRGSGPPVIYPDPADHECKRMYRYDTLVLRRPGFSLSTSPCFPSDIRGKMKTESFTLDSKSYSLQDMKDRLIKHEFKYPCGFSDYGACLDPDCPIIRHYDDNWPSFDNFMHIPYDMNVHNQMFFELVYLNFIGLNSEFLTYFIGNCHPPDSYSKKKGCSPGYPYHVMSKGIVEVNMREGVVPCVISSDAYSSSDSGEEWI